MIRQAMLWTDRENKSADCVLCSHRCSVAPGKWGVCGVRENRAGILVTHVYGEVIAANVDPIEKKPLYHFLPGTTSFSIAAPGCNFRCGFCQNWRISQLQARDHGLRDGGGQGQLLPPEAAARVAVERGCASISYTYTEPTIFFEYAYDTALRAKALGLANVFVTNGFMTPEALDTIRPYLDAANVDLKSFRDETYKKICKGRLQPVLDSIRLMKKLGIWVEVTTLVVPGLNDDESELRGIASFLAETDRLIPWHISRFHPDFQFTDRRATPLEALRRAAEIGREAGLAFVYVGNVAGEGDATLCPRCGATLVRRSGLWTEECTVVDGRCPACRAEVPGRFAPTGGPAR
jgi:pyruvate formate lyase activating enzyme